MLANVPHWERTNAVWEKKHQPAFPNDSLQRLPVVKPQHCNQISTVLQQKLDEVGENEAVEFSVITVGEKAEKMWLWWMMVCTSYLFASQVRERISTQFTVHWELANTLPPPTSKGSILLLATRQGEPPTTSFPITMRKAALAIARTDYITRHAPFFFFSWVMTTFKWSYRVKISK